MVNYQPWSYIKALAKLRKKGKKVSWLKYKTSPSSFKTLNINQSEFKIEGNKFTLSKIGEIPVEHHRLIKGRIKGVIVKRTKSGKWYAIVQAESEPEPLPSTGKAIGMDVGVRHFLTDSEGRQIKNPRFYEKTLGRIRILQRNLSRMQKISKNREKCRLKLDKTHEKLVNQRNDFLYELSRFYVNNYDVIVVEDLQIQSLVRNHDLAQKIPDASWSKFLQPLSYKAERTSGRVVWVIPRGISEGLSDSTCRDYISACRMLMWGLGRCSQPVERKPLLLVTSQQIIEGQVSFVKREAPYVNVG